MRHLKENWIHYLGAVFVAVWLYAGWSVQRGGHIKAWAETPLSRATMADFIPLAIVFALVCRRGE